MAPSEPRPEDAQLNWPGEPERVAVAPGTTPRAQAGGGGALPSWEQTGLCLPCRGGRSRRWGVTLGLRPQLPVAKARECPVPV